MKATLFHLMVLKTAKFNKKNYKKYNNLDTEMIEKFINKKKFKTLNFKG